MQKSAGWQSGGARAILVFASVNLMGAMDGEGVGRGMEGRGMWGVVDNETDLFGPRVSGNEAGLYVPGRR
jgi:hypothetical protein